MTLRPNNLILKESTSIYSRDIASEVGIFLIDVLSFLRDRLRPSNQWRPKFTSNEGSVVGNDNNILLLSPEGYNGDPILVSLCAGNCDRNCQYTILEALECRNNIEILRGIRSCADVRNILLNERVGVGLVKLDISRVNMILSLEFRVDVRSSITSSPCFGLAICILSRKSIVAHRHEVHTLNTVNVALRHENEGRESLLKVELEVLILTFLILHVVKDEFAVLKLSSDGTNREHGEVGLLTLCILARIVVPETVSVRLVETAVLAVLTRSTRSARSAILTISDGAGLSITCSDHETVISGGHASDNTSSIDLRLKILDGGRKLGVLLLQLVDVIIVVRTRYGYTREAQDKGSSEEQVFNFFVHS